ncbi:MAG TPA: ABC transporter permease [Bryobacteraceae bacterium]|nr:ABC transporter permease [Bryobacteraceae bacterium]
MKSLRFALRTLAKSPVFTGIAVLSLALGIGANTAIFTLMDQVLLRMLPIREPERIVQLNEKGPKFGTTRGQKTTSYPMYLGIRDGSTHVFDGLIAKYGNSVALGYKGKTERATAEVVTGNYFDVLGVRPRLGRLLTPEDDRSVGGHPVAVLAFEYWERRFGSDRNILQQTLLVNGHPFQVIGVTQPGYRGLEVGSATDVFVPIMMKKQATPTWDSLDNRNDRWLNVFGRLKPGMTEAKAQAALEPLYKQLVRLDADTLPAERVDMRPRFLKEKTLGVEWAGKGPSTFRESAEAPLWVLMTMVGLVLLIACANVANLLTARAAGRQREIAIRVSLGATRWQIARQLLTESAVLSFAGGCLGLLVSVWTGDLLLSFVPFEEAPRAFSTAPDARVLAFNFAISALAAVIFGLVPAIQAARHAISDTLKTEAGNLSSSVGQVRLRKGLVVAQISLSLLLLIGAGLFARSLFNLRGMHPGFAVENLMTFSIEPSLSGYQRERAIDFFERTLQAMQNTPGTRLVSAADVPLMTENRNMYSIKIGGYTPKNNEDMTVDVNMIGPSFFSTVGVPIVAGREFTYADRAGSPLVCVINEAMAKAYFGSGNPLGRRLAFGRNKDRNMREIVGVVKNQKTTNLRAEPLRYVFAPLLQEENPNQATFYLRTATEPLSTATAIRAKMQRLDANVPVNDMKSMEVQVTESLFVERLVATLSAFFGLLATLLAAIGLYGVMAYSVARRTREIGIRVALGAERSGVIQLVMREVALMAGIGIGVGLPLALALSRFLRSQLFGLEAADPMTLAIATLTMALVALSAGYIPAERAARVDPIVALRYE